MVVDRAAVDACRVAVEGGLHHHSAIILVIGVQTATHAVGLVFGEGAVGDGEWTPRIDAAAMIGGAVAGDLSIG